MNNQNAIKFFKNIANSKDNNPNSVKLAHNTDYTYYDKNLILKFVDNNTKLLDIGSGSGLIINKIYKNICKIECVEQFSEFTKFIVESDNIKVVNSNLFDYNTDEKFDVITAFGLMHYFNELEAITIYKKYYKYLKQNGVLIIKNQFGIDDDVTVAGYSQEQKTDYFAQYRHVDKEIDILKDIGFKNIEKIDIYPPEANRWNNTHFYAIVAEKN